MFYNRVNKQVCKFEEINAVFHLCGPKLSCQSCFIGNRNRVAGIRLRECTVYPIFTLFE
jgi:hypothetical protein